MTIHLPDPAAMLGLDPTTALFLWFLLYIAANAVSRLIPEDAEGWQRHVRVAASIIGVHVKNRVHQKITPEAMTTAFVVEAAKHLPVKPPEPEEIVIPPEFKAFLQAQLPPENETDHEG